MYLNSARARVGLISPFRITFALFLKASLGAHPFISKLVFICMWMKTNFHPYESWAPGLALKKRPKLTRKWPIVLVLLCFCLPVLMFFACHSLFRFLNVRFSFIRVNSCALVFKYQLCVLLCTYVCLFYSCMPVVLLRICSLSLLSLGIFHHQFTFFVECDLSRVQLIWCVGMKVEHELRRVKLRQ